MNKSQQQRFPDQSPGHRLSVLLCSRFRCCRRFDNAPMLSIPNPVCPLLLDVAAALAVVHRHEKSVTAVMWETEIPTHCLRLVIRVESTAGLHITTRVIY